MRKRLVARTRDHSLDCVNPCYNGFCQSRMASQLKEFYAARFTFQSLLAIRHLDGNPAHAHQLLRQWQATITILRGVESLKQLDLERVRFFSTCSDNPSFNDAPSAILSDWDHNLRQYWSMVEERVLVVQMGSRSTLLRSGWLSVHACWETFNCLRRTVAE